MSKKNLIMKRKEGLYLKAAGHKGRGVFCVSNIKAGEVLEVTPALILNEAATDRTSKTILVNYVFEIGKFSKGLRDRLHIKRTDHASAVIMGIASFCNHDEKPNAEIVWEEREGALYYSLTATRSIPKNTEICTGYGEGWFDDKD
jgi:SET domain-containing protein